MVLISPTTSTPSSSKIKSAKPRIGGSEHRISLSLSLKNLVLEINMIIDIHIHIIIIIIINN
jgi:hypothetical protein